MFVIDPAGKIVYNGAIDDKRSARESDRKTANNYVRAALAEATAGKPVTVASTSPYGCSSSTDASERPASEAPGRPADHAGNQDRSAQRFGQT